MSRTALVIVNPDAESAVGAPWVSATNTLTRSGGSFAYAGSNSFTVTSAGAYDFYQDVAIPLADYAQVDAGLRTVEYEAYGAISTSTATSLTLYLKALDGGGSTLQTWSQVVSVAGKPYTQFAVRLQTLPALTRTLRVGWSGTKVGIADAWVDALSLAVDDLTLMAFKFNGYAVGAEPAANLVATKFNEYAVAGAGIGLVATKFIAYGVVGEGTPATSNQRIRVALVCRTRAIP